MIKWSVEELYDTVCDFCKVPLTSCQKLYRRSDGLYICKCSNCDLLLVNPRPKTEHLLNKVYNSYFTGYDNFHYGVNYFETLDDAIETGTATGFPQLKKVINDWQGLRHLDIGCGGGALIVSTRLLGSIVKGIEINKDCVDHVQKKYKLDVFHGHLKEAGFRDKSFDLVTGIDLLEHIEEPNKFLHEANRILAKGGRLALIVPNAKCLDRLGTQWIGLHKNMEHLSYFTPDTLRKCLALNGFEEIYHETFGYAQKVTINNNDVLSDIQSTNGFYQIARNLGPLTEIARTVRDLYRGIIEKRGFGHNLFMIARKV